MWPFVPPSGEFLQKGRLSVDDCKSSGDWWWHKHCQQQESIYHTLYVLASKRRKTKKVLSAGNRKCTQNCQPLLNIVVTIFEVHGGMTECGCHFRASIIGHLSRLHEIPHHIKVEERGDEREEKRAATLQPAETQVPKYLVRK